MKYPRIHLKYVFMILWILLANPRGPSLPFSFAISRAADLNYSALGLNMSHRLKLILKLSRIWFDWNVSQCNLYDFWELTVLILILTWTTQRSLLTVVQNWKLHNFSIFVCVFKLCSTMKFYTCNIIASARNPTFFKLFWFCDQILYLMVYSTAQNLLCLLLILINDELLSYCSATYIALLLLLLWSNKAAECYLLFEKKHITKTVLSWLCKNSPGWWNLLKRVLLKLTVLNCLPYFFF